MSLVDSIRKDMFNASKMGNTVKSDILKLVLADIKNEEISTGKTLDDDGVVKVMRRQQKRIEDSISQFTHMQRDDLVEREKIQLLTVQTYLPTLMSSEDITKVVKSIIAEMETPTMKDMGMIMSRVMKELNGKADGSTVREIVQSLLS